MIQFDLKFPQLVKPLQLNPLRLCLLLTTHDRVHLILVLTMMHCYYLSTIDLKLTPSLKLTLVLKLTPSLIQYAGPH